MVVTIFGLGFVGLTTALAFADKGITVYGLEVNEERRRTIADGKLPFHEPGLDEALVRNIDKRFFVDETLENAVRMSDCVYYCVGTPYGEDGQADLTFLFSAIDSTLKSIEKGNYTVLVVKSTVPPSTTKEQVSAYVEEKGYRVGEDIGIANNPEFLREGHCWEDATEVDRVVLGVSDAKAEQVLLKLYSDYNCPVHVVSLNTGEFIKYLSNTLLATLISWSNEMSLVADTVGDVQVAEAFRILHEDKRWGVPKANMTAYAYPGCGYGGYCLPKDTNALYAHSKSRGFEPQMLGKAIAVNDAMPSRIAERVIASIDGEKRIGICGLSFKPGSDDVRDTPAAKVINELFKRGFDSIVGYDPIAIEEFQQHYSFAMEYQADYDKFVETTDVFVITTAWPVFRELPIKAKGKTIIDARYML